MVMRRERRQDGRAAEGCSSSRSCKLLSLCLSSGPYWALPGLTGPCLVLLFLPGPYWTLLSALRGFLAFEFEDWLTSYNMTCVLLLIFFFEFYTLWIHLMLFDLFIQYVAMFNILEAPSYLQIQIQIQSLLIYIFLSNLSTLEHPSHQRNKVLEGSLLCMVTCLDLKYKFKIKT